MNSIRISLLIILCCICSVAFCQTQLNFISNTNKKKLTFKVGEKINYSTKGVFNMHTGKLEAIKDSSIIVKSDTIKIKDIKLLGHRKRGVALIAGITAAASGFILGYFALPANNSDSEKILGFSIAVPLFVFSEVIGLQNKAYRVSKKYHCEILP